MERRCAAEQFAQLSDDSGIGRVVSVVDDDDDALVNQRERRDDLLYPTGRTTAAGTRIWLQRIRWWCQEARMGEGVEES